MAAGVAEFGFSEWKAGVKPSTTIGWARRSSEVATMSSRREKSYWPGAVSTWFQ